jgi:hypothetical protein
MKDHSQISCGVILTATNLDSVSHQEVLDTFLERTFARDSCKKMDLLVCIEHINFAKRDINYCSVAS